LKNKNDKQLGVQTRNNTGTPFFLSYQDFYEIVIQIGKPPTSVNTPIVLEKNKWCPLR
jgi:hypothetical protein